MHFFLANLQITLIIFLTIKNIRYWMFPSSDFAMKTIWSSRLMHNIWPVQNTLFCTYDRFHELAPIVMIDFMSYLPLLLILFYVILISDFSYLYFIEFYKIKSKEYQWELTHEK